MSTGQFCDAQIMGILKQVEGVCRCLNCVGNTSLHLSSMTASYAASQRSWAVLPRREGGLCKGRNLRFADIGDYCGIGSAALAR